MAGQTIRRLLFPTPEQALDIIGAWLIGGAVMSALRTAIGRQVPLFFVVYVVIGYWLIKRSRKAYEWATFFVGLYWAVGMGMIAYSAWLHPTASRIYFANGLPTVQAPVVLAWLDSIVYLLAAGWAFANLIRADVRNATVRPSNELAAQVREAQSA